MSSRFFLVIFIILNLIGCLWPPVDHPPRANFKYEIVNVFEDAVEVQFTPTFLSIEGQKDWDKPGDDCEVSKFEWTWGDETSTGQLNNKTNPYNKPIKHSYKKSRIIELYNKQNININVKVQDNKIVYYVNVSLSIEDAAEQKDTYNKSIEIFEVENENH